MGDCVALDNLVNDLLNNYFNDEEIQEMTERKLKRNMVISDLHIPYQDKKAVDYMLDFTSKYRPDNLVINGDLVDFYGISVYSKNPENKDNLASETMKARQFLSDLRKATGTECNIQYLVGNHEVRLQQYIWNHPELEGLKELELGNLLDIKKYNIRMIEPDNDYWSKCNGHIKLGDIVIMHGDDRLNGASLSNKSGYSAMNTMLRLNSSAMIGHCHRLGQVYHTTPYNDMTGIETGCLCQVPDIYNWQQGFVTFETFKGKNLNYRLHKI